MIRVSRNPAGPRVYVLGRRLHHGTTGVALIVWGAGLRRWRRRLALGCGVAGLLLLAHDRHDFPFRDTDNH